jgi:hypothetical protein
MTDSLNTDGAINNGQSRETAHLFSFLDYFFIVVSLCSVSCVAFVSDLSIRDSI